MKYIIISRNEDLVGLEDITNENLKKEYLEALLSEDQMFCGPVKGLVKICYPTIN